MGCIGILPQTCDEASLARTAIRTPIRPYKTPSVSQCSPGESGHLWQKFEPFEAARGPAGRDHRPRPSDPCASYAPVHDVEHEARGLSEPESTASASVALVHSDRLKSQRLMHLLGRNEVHRGLRGIWKNRSRTHRGRAERRVARQGTLSSWL